MQQRTQGHYRRLSRHTVRPVVSYEPLQSTVERQRKAQQARRPGRSNVLFSLTTLALALIASPDVAFARETFGSKARVTSYYRTRVAFIQFVGELYNGDVDRGEGSGFLVGESLVLTNSHVIPRLANYRKATVAVQFPTDAGVDQIEATLADRDGDADLALLRLTSPRAVSHPPCPIETFAQTGSAPPGSDIVVLGYPVGTGFSVTAGVVSNQNRPGRWQTDAAINPGNSGGPVFDLDGYFLGVAVAGMTWFGDDRTGSYVSGVNFFVPVEPLMASPIAKHLSSAPTCWSVADATPDPAVAVASTTQPKPTTVASTWSLNFDHKLVTFENVANPSGPGSLTAGLEELLAPTASTLQSTTSASEGGEISALPHQGIGPDQTVTTVNPKTDAGLLRELNEQVPVSWMKDDNDGFAKSSRTYVKRVLAEPGYIIESCDARAQSANNARSTVCVIAVDGKSAEFTTKLESGPFYDRWRGWWHGDLTLKQHLIDDKEATPPG